MQLFDAIPPRLFSPLSSQKRDIYCAALFTLGDLFDNQLVISRDEVEAALQQALGDVLESADFRDEDDGEDVRLLSGKVQFILRRLKDTGWIEYESSKDSFVENLSLPYHTVAIVKTLKSLCVERKSEYNRNVYTVYAALKESRNNPDYRLSALNEAYEKAEAFMTSLKVLFNNIKGFYQRIGQLGDVNSLLRDHFDFYVSEVSKKVIEPLRTIDSVPRFKNRIIEMLDELERDEAIFSSLVEKAVATGESVDAESAEADIRYKIHQTIEIFSTVEGTIEEIYAKNTAYIQSSIERMRYLMASDKGAKGNIDAILKRASMDESFASRLPCELGLVRTMLLDQSSLFDRISRRSRDEGPRQAVRRYSEDEDLKEGFLEDLRKQFSTSRIDDFILSKMEGEAVDGADIAIAAIDDFLLFVLATVRSTEEDCPFTCDFVQGEDRRGSIVVPKCTFRRR